MKVLDPRSWEWRSLQPRDRLLILGSMAAVILTPIVIAIIAGLPLLGVLFVAAITLTVMAVSWVIESHSFKPDEDGDDGLAPEDRL